MSKITVMCVDDSALMRQLMTEIINSHPDMEMVATAPDPLVAAQMALLRVLHAADMPDPGALAKTLEDLVAR